MKDSFQTPMAGLQVPLHDIEDALNAFWLDAAKGDESALVRASTLSLVILTTSEERFSDILNRVPDCTFHHPSRIIMVYINRDSSTQKISAGLSVHCRLPQHVEKQICCEIITLRTGKAGVVHLSGALLPLLLPGLPVFLWLTDPQLLENAQLEPFFKMTDRLIVDLEHGADHDVRKAVKRLLHFRDLLISDMSWSRMIFWRESVARFFDNAAGPEWLAHISEVKVEHARRNTYHALLLIGWMASLLRWVRDDVDGRIGFKNRSGAYVAVRLAESPVPGIRSGIGSITILTHDAQNSITLHAWLKNDRILSWEISTVNASVQSRDEDLHSRDEIESLCHELDFLQRDTVFVQTLETVFPESTDC